jgi:hypothetical protein
LVRRSAPCVRDPIPALLMKTSSPFVIGEHSSRKLPRAGQRRQIRLIEDGLAVPCPPDVVGKGFDPIAVAAMNQHLRAPCGEFGGDITADAIGRSGDQNSFAVHLHVTAPARRCRQP